MYSYIKLFVLIPELLLRQNFVTHPPTNKQFPIILKYFSRYQKRVHSSKTGHQIFLRNQYFLFIYAKESKNLLLAMYLFKKT